MTRKMVNRLLVTAGLTLLAVVGVVLPLCAAPLSHPTQPQEVDDVTLKVAATTAGQSLTLTATVRNSQSISITNVNLEFILPLATITNTTPLTHHWAFIEPTTTVTHPILLRVPDQVSGTLRFTATLQHGVTQTEVPGRSIEVILVSTEALPPSVTPTVSRSPLPSPSPIPATPTPTPITLTPTPIIPIPTPALTPPLDVIALLLENKSWIGGGCLLLFLLILGLLLILWALRRKKPRPKPVLPAPPPPAVVAPHLESIGAPGGPRCFDLQPGGITIGRGPENGLVITQDYPGWETVSHSHARIYRQADHWIVEDLDSTNGVYVNGKRTGHNFLRDNWRLGIGGVEFIFHAGTGEAQL